MRKKTIANFIAKNIFASISSIYRLNGIIFLYLTIFTIVFSSCIEEPELKGKNTNLGNFEALWTAIDTKYCYLDYKKVNWDSVHTAYKMRVDSTMNNYEFFKLMGEMLDELKDGHVNLISDFNVSRYRKWFSDYAPNFNSKIVFSERYLSTDYNIAGGMRYAKIENDSIGYIYYDDFTTTFTDTNIRYIFNYFANCKGLIIDVRNNGGGYLDLSEKLASYFFKEEKITGFIQYKIGNGHTDFSTPTTVKTPSHKTIHWEKPVCILSNRLSYSATNSLIVRMKMAPNATIIGDKSGGGGGLPLSTEIPNGWLVRFSACPMFDAEMNQTEWGIEPDIKSALTATDEANGIDTIIEKAIEVINKK